MGTHVDKVPESAISGIDIEALYPDFVSAAHRWIFNGQPALRWFFKLILESICHFRIGAKVIFLEIYNVKK